MAHEVHESGRLLEACIVLCAWSEGNFVGKRKIRRLRASSDPCTSFSTFALSHKAKAETEASDDQIFKVRGDPKTGSRLSCSQGNRRRGTERKVYIVYMLM